MDSLISSVIQDLENGKKTAYQMRSLIQQLEESDGVSQLDQPNHDHLYYNQGFNDHFMVVLSAFDNALSKLQRCDNNTTKIEYSGHSTLVGGKAEGGLTPKGSIPKYRSRCFKRRKIGVSDTVITVPKLTDDGYAWRKYGQKNILNGRYPRNYYRCTHKFEQGCQATKQVQQMTEKPDQYRVIYQGEHTCKTIVTKTPLIIPHDHDHQDSTYVLDFNNPTPPKHSLNPLIFPPSPSPPSSSTPSQSPSLSSSSWSPFAMVKQECYVPIMEGNQPCPSDLHQSSDLTSSSITTALDQGDVMSSSIDVQNFYSSGVAYHGIDSVEFNNMMADSPIFDDMINQDILCV